ncbi:PLP-dependent aminotransferase family protein [Vibrio olivae]|uniref:PLP-dependent aminotransferase family protein n=1 Tax=Vibrio olivae TaxID=1243002 RepID=A0ABV5HPW3_9VIBR
MIDIGDLRLESQSMPGGGHKPKHTQLFEAIRHKIVAGLWRNQAQLPSTRALAAELALSRNTVISAYEQLVAEGYIESRRGAGYYVAIALPEQFIGSAQITELSTSAPAPQDFNQPFAPGVADLERFPCHKWQRYVQRHSTRKSLLGHQSRQGYLPLRETLSEYLSSSRSVSCNPQRVIITSGAQQALTIALMATVSREQDVLMEQPGYAQMTNVIELLGYRLTPVTVSPYHGLNLEQVLASRAKALYITPSNQYPMGTSLTTEQRLSLIEWATNNDSWIIEDDYDSEFQFAHRPYSSLQGLAAGIHQDERVIYIGSFSKTMFNGLRLGYLVVPEHLVESCLALKNILTGDSPTHTQAALAEFIAEGEFVRHLRRMRRLYHQKHAQMLASLARHLGERVEVVSQAAGLHITLRWYAGIEEQIWVERAKQQGIVIRPLSYYQSGGASKRDWRGAVLGFGNVAIDQIDTLIQRLAKLFTI